MTLLPGCSNPFDQATLQGNQAVPEGTAESLGRLRLRFAKTGEAARNLYPEFETPSKYVLSFTHEDGEAAPDLVIEEEEQILVELKAGTWEIVVHGFLPRTGEAEAAAIRGRAAIAVEAGKENHTLIVLDTPVAGTGIRGIFSYTVDFPRDLVSSAVMELSILGAGETYIPHTVLDLGEGETRAASLSLPAGYYRMDLRLGTLFETIRKTEIVHIYPAMETRAPPYRFEEASFPVPVELEGIAALEAYLTEQPDNTETTPYLIKLKGFNLSGGESSPGEDLSALYKALVRYTALDLRDCTGESFSKLSLAKAPHKANLVSLLLPKSVKTIEAGAFADCSSLLRVEAPGLGSIELELFRDCKKLESIYMPRVESIADTLKVAQGSFRNCASLYAVFLPKLRFIGGYAFYNCTSLERIFFPEGRRVGANAFAKCAALISASLPQTESIEYRAFYGCAGFKNLVLGESPPDLGSQALTGGRPHYIYVPAEAAYAETTKENWTPALKEKIRIVPE
jgi:hypothetical protein